MRAARLRERIAEVLGEWSRSAGGSAPRVLEGTDLEHAVARGAAYDGLSRRRGDAESQANGAVVTYMYAGEDPDPTGEDDSATKPFNNHQTNFFTVHGYDCNSCIFFNTFNNKVQCFRC